jgi:putative protease
MADTRPELLAPAGDFDCVRAAIENGADAVYFGLDVGFNARARATNFPVESLPELMRMLHRRGLKGYATLNTLVFSDELDAFAGVVAAVAVAGVDAVLLQDVGAATLVREICPTLPLHASTQMTLTSAETIRLAESLGIERVVVARELSVAEIAAIRPRTSLELEVFVHGALCVAYSGQCLTSESLGGRSANRGQCAQACRLPYEVVCDGRDVDLGDQKYLLSPQDLAAWELVPGLVAAGVSSLKIEGRLKTPEYVAAVTRHYRTAIDQCVQSLPVRLSAQAVEEMELAFSRGFSHGWLGGIDHKALVPAISSAKRGVRLGSVVGVGEDHVAIELAAPLKRGDGIAIDCGRIDRGEGNERPMIGGSVYAIRRDGRWLEEPATGGHVEVSFAPGAVQLGKVRPGQTVWKTFDPQVTSRLRGSFESAVPKRRTPVDLVIHAAVGEPVRLWATLAGGVAVDIATEHVAAEARRHVLDETVLREQLGRLGGTPFELGKLTATIEGRPMVPLSVLGSLRHELVRRLEDAATTREPRPVAARDRSRRSPSMQVAPAAGGEPMLHVLVRSMPQLEAVLALGERRLYAEFADIRHYREAITAARGNTASLFVATPRIHKPDEMGMFQLLAKQAPDGVLVRNFAGLEFFRDRGVRVVGDFSLNVANERTAAFFLERGLERLTASYDCNREQLLAFLAAARREGFAIEEAIEVVVHQRMPMFHMEHCVFCAVLSPGTNKTNCGRPCDDHAVKLRDRIGVEHPLTADVGCRNTLYNAVPQSGAEAVPALGAAGVRHFRVELLDEEPDEIRRILAAYRGLLAGSRSGGDVWRELKAANRVGVTRGTLEESRNPLAIL